VVEQQEEEEIGASNLTGEEPINLERRGREGPAIN